MSNNACPLESLSGASGYYGVFLTFRCAFNCSFCVNRFHAETLASYPEVAGREWIKFFRLLDPGATPLVLQGGEPGRHRDFIEIVQELSSRYRVAIITSLGFDVRTFIGCVNPDWLNRDPARPAIRVSYHPEQADAEDIIRKAGILKEAGFRVSCFGFTNGTQSRRMLADRELCRSLGIHLELLPFLDWYQRRFYGGEYGRDTAGLLFAPDGSIYHSHHHLYNRLPPAGHIQRPLPLQAPQPLAADFCAPQAAATG